jgi:hypothetical protein
MYDDCAAVLAQNLSATGTSPALNQPPNMVERSIIRCRVTFLERSLSRQPGDRWYGNDEATLRQRRPPLQPGRIVSLDVLKSQLHCATEFFKSGRG